MQIKPIRLLSLLIVLGLVASSAAWSQDANRDLTKKKEKAKKESRDEDAGEPWKKMPLLLDRPEKPYEVIGLVSAPQVFLWDDEEAMKESMQKQAWKMRADAVILDRVDTSFRFTGPAGGANGRAIRYKE